MKFKTWYWVFFSVLAILGCFSLPKLRDMFNGKITVAENLTLDLVEWQFERPSRTLGFDDFLRIICTNYTGDISINQTIIVDNYEDSDSSFGGSPSLDFALDLVASLSRGYVEGVNITFYDDHLNSFVEVWEDSSYHILNGLTLVRYSHFNIGSVEKGFINFGGVNQPRSIHLFNPIAWALRTSHNETQELTVKVEVTYFNGTAYKRVVQPFKLRLTADMNESFENAEIINFGELLWRLLGGDDREDYYKVFLEKGETINITMTPLWQEDFDLYLYGPGDRNNPAANSTRRSDVIESIEYVADTAGWWFIKVRQVGGWGIYSLHLTIVKED